VEVLGIAERLIVKSEGFTNYVYADPNGDATAGPGKFLHEGPPTRAEIEKYGTKKNPKMSRATYFRMLDELINQFERGVEDILRDFRIAVNRCEFSALVSIAYNIGLTALRNSSIIKSLRKNHRSRAGAKFMLWVLGNGGIKLPGLVIRRARERRLFRGKHKHVACGVRKVP
jgi:GH24 family phage-related lysozyme (muramidase)